MVFFTLERRSGLVTTELYSISGLTQLLVFLIEPLGFNVLVLPDICISTVDLILPVEPLSMSQYGRNFDLG